MGPLSRKRERLRICSLSRLRERARVRAPLQRKQDLFKHDRHLSQHIVIPETQNTKAVPFDEACAIVVVRSSFHMLTTIQLDHQLGVEAGEVGEVRADRALPAELVIVESSIAQVIPEQSFCVCWRLA